jgi:Lysozyme inhibitor LprI
MTKSIDLDAIFQKQSRLSKFAHHIISYRIIELQKLWDADRSSVQPLADMVPVRLVAYLENAIRVAVKQLVDFGSPFNARGIKLLARGSIKDSATLLLAVHTDQVSLGDLISHSISTNDMGSIINTLELIIGENFKHDISSIRNRFEVEIEHKPDVPIIDDLDQTIRIINRMIEVRHIVIHEMPTKTPYKSDDLGCFIGHAYQFISALEWLVMELQFGRVPLTQADINIDAGKRAEESREKLDAILTIITSQIDDSEVRERFLNTQPTWETFINLQADARAGRVGKHSRFPGSMAPMRYANEVEARINERIADLEAHYSPDGKVKEGY